MYGISIVGVASALVDKSIRYDTIILPNQRVKRKGPKDNNK